METCSRYMNNKYLILILYYLKFLKEPNIFQSLIWRILSRVKPIINHTLPMTLRKLRGFLDITGYCHIWIPGYGELAQPLYKLRAETQQAPTDKLVWSPDTQKAFKALQTVLLQAPALSLPTGSEFNLFVTERKGMALGVLTQSRGPHQQPYCLSKQRIRCNFKWVAPLPKSNWGSSFISTWSFKNN